MDAHAYDMNVCLLSFGLGSHGSIFNSSNETIEMVYKCIIYGLVDILCDRDLTRLDYQNIQIHTLAVCTIEIEIVQSLTLFW